MFSGWRFLIIIGFVVLGISGCGVAAGERLVAMEDVPQAEWYLDELPETEIDMELVMPRDGGLALIAHAAAAIRGWEGSNTLEAMENAINLGFKYIELDMLYTTDGEIILNHNWYHISNRIPGVENGIMSHEEFMSHRIFGQFTPVDLELLIDFLRRHPEPRIITDTKDTDYAALYAIAEHFPEYMHRFIAQAYTFDDVQRIRNLGFEDIILTIYMMGFEDRDPARIHAFAMEQELYAVAMPESWAIPAFVGYLDMNEMRYIAHTIDSVYKASVLYTMGFYAIYTGHLAYDGRGGLVEIPIALSEYMDMIAHNIYFDLDEDQEDLLSVAVFHKMGVPANIHAGEIAAVRADMMSAPFISPITGLAYLPARHFERYTEGMDWQPEARVLNITVNGWTRPVRGANHALFLYRDMLFISENVLRDVIGLEVLVRDDYVVVIVQDDIDEDVTDDDLFEVAEILFRDLVREPY